MSGYNKITVMNGGAYDLEFQVEWTDPATHKTPYSSAYPNPQSETIDMSNGTYAIALGNPMRPHMKAILGKHKHGDWVTYDPSGPTAVYRAEGTTLDPQLILQS